MNKHNLLQTKALAQKVFQNSVQEFPILHFIFHYQLLNNNAQCKFRFKEHYETSIFIITIAFNQLNNIIENKIKFRISAIDGTGPDYLDCSSPIISPRLVQSSRIGPSIKQCYCVGLRKQVCLYSLEHPSLSRSPYSPGVLEGPLRSDCVLGGRDRAVILLLVCFLLSKAAMLSCGQHENTETQRVHINLLTLACFPTAVTSEPR